jgi:hypothetical protein
MELDKNERQLLGFMELNGQDFDHESEKAYGRSFSTNIFALSKYLLTIEIPLICDGNYLNLTFKANALVIKNVQEGGFGPDHIWPITPPPTIRPV